jgi:hypothetical protein
MERRTGGIAVAVVLVAGLVFAGALWLRHDPEVAMLGDSLLYLSEDEVRADLQGWQPDISAFPGTTIGQQLPEARRLVATHPKAMVIVLGANNTIDGVRDDDAAELDQMLDVLDAVPCVRWLNVADVTPRPTFNAAAEEMNALLQSHVAGHANVRIVDWAAAIHPHPDWFAPGDIHPVQAGQNVLAQEITGSLDGC